MAVRKGWILAVLVVFGLAGLGLVGLGLVFSEKRVKVQPASTLVLDFSDSILEDMPADAESRFFYRDTPTLWDHLRALDHAADDPNIEAVLLRIDNVDLGWAKSEELRAKLEELQERGTKVVAYVEGGGDHEYMMASAADVIYMAPNTQIYLDGLASYEMFFKGTLDKLGVRADLEHIGEYKSAAEQFTQREASDAAREASIALLDATYADLLAAIGESRGLDSAAVARIIDAGPYTSKQAHAAGLIDSLIYPDQLEDLLPGGEGGSQLSVEEYLATLPPVEGSPNAPKIAIVHATGTIVGGESGTDPMWGRTVGSDSFLEALEEARDEKGVRAIVVRIDSPGGEVYASHLMWRAIREASTDLPVVASFSDLAASGGYYMAMGADTVVSDRATLTGSIGVIGGKFNLGGLYEKLGMNVEVHSRGENAQFQSSLRDFTPAERERYRSEMFEEYQTFVGIVAQNRGTSAERIDEVARGRVWTGRMAKERGLVDIEGGLETSIDVAKKMAGLAADQGVRVEIFPRIKRTFVQEFVNKVVEDEDLGAAVRSRARSGALSAAPWLAGLLKPELELMGALLRLRGGGKLAVLPFRIEIR
ncbi:MAG: signal peptide peptidase SppA [Candidatus Eisenbacteria bacterium]